jgi:hypothetical protein
VASIRWLRHNGLRKAREVSREVMMLGSGHLISGLDVATGTFALMVFSAGAALVVLAIVVRLVLRRAGQGGAASTLWVCGLALAGTLLGYMGFEHFVSREQATDRRAIEARAAELTARSLAPGSALGCLDAVANILVENACEKPLFASPEAVAAAVAYIDARISLLSASTALAERDPSYQPVLERLRRGLEADRYGVVAHVLTTRGCGGADCPELKLLRDPARVVANMKARVFESALGAHALAWTSAGTPTAAVASMPAPLTTGTGPGAAITSGGPGAASPSKFDFPSANSIPAVSIMNAEPGTPAAEPRSTALPPKRPTAASRRQSAREAAAPPPPPPPQPPVQAAPEEAPLPVLPDPHATH